MHGFRTHYASTHNRYLRNRFNVCGGFYRNNAYRFHYSSWFNRGFCGGFYYPVHPWYEIDTYFIYPMVNWMYVGTVDTDYYREWYGADYDACPVTKFAYAGAFFPTQQMRDLGMEASGLTPALQCGFRTAMLTMTRSLVEQVSLQIGASFVLADSDIVVTHYQNLSDTGYVLEGFINHDTINLPFKAVVDVVTPANTYAFIPTQDEPNPVDEANLDKVNNRIKDLGGNPDQVDEEPDTLVTPPPAQ